ncbi:DUF2169 domain-containing protein [Ectothiorhodospira shaposhnikovii]|uniref:DUF2169 domain-containing protein n=1 Tax=Ectothiorhodospira shaposhnikovii TaxID=1054 RepID=UPI001EE86F42|nr:DUF2169 domain-containing protein [Ectothiorhodospira shaposhnikovii]MCG5513100.1 DUF2169 domain-containing protein [Ectothiorhodospira shaposhnikovii]
MTLELYNRSPWSVGLFSGRARDGTPRYTLVVKRTHRFVPSREDPEPLHPCAPLITADIYQDEPGDSPLLRATETVPFKQGADVLITGLDGLMDGLDARTLKLTLCREGRILLDKILHRQGVTSRRRGWPRPWAGPMSRRMGSGPVPGHAAPQTRRLLGLAPLPTRLMTLPFQESLPADAFNQAPPDQRLAEPLEGHEILSLQPMSGRPGAEPLRLRLPAEPITAWCRIRGQQMKPLTPVCDTLWLEGDTGLLHHIHRAGIPATADTRGQGWVIVEDRRQAMARIPVTEPLAT